MRHIVIAAGLLALAGCEHNGLACWSRLQDLNNEMTLMLFETGEIDASAFRELRSRIASNVEQCRGGDFYRDFNTGLGPGEILITLFDLAVMANDVELAAEMYERHLELSPEFRAEKLLLEGAHLESAAYVEAVEVAEWLLANGYDADQIDGIGGTPLFYSGTRTEDGLRLTRALVAHGADLEHASSSGDTPLSIAWRQGNLRKVQCLVSLGAEIPEPLPAMEEPRVTIADPWEVEQVTAFLSNSDRLIPENIASICIIAP